MKKILILLFASILVISSIPPSYAIDLTLDSASAEWTATVGGANVMGIGTSEVRWGFPFGQPFQSGFRFDVPPTLPDVISTGTPFPLGDFVHLNFPVGAGSAISGATLDLDLEITNGNTEMETFTFNFLIDETPNTGGGCCDDIITFLNSMASTTITIDGIEYELELLGFGPTPNNLVNMFVTQENMESSAMLWAQLGPVLDPVGGELLPINTTSLLLAGIQSSAMWILPIAFTGAGIIAFKLRKYWN